MSIETTNARSSRELTDFERAGTDWWNTRSELARGYWLKQAASAAPADAWAAYQAQPATCRAYRVFDGICLQGRDLYITVTAAEGGLGVTVNAEPGATGYSMACRLSADHSPSRYAPDEIHVAADSLECFAACRSYPLYREGFKLKIDPEMAEQLRQWLPRLTVSSALATAMVRAVEHALPQEKPVLHMQGFTTELAARIALDGQAPAEALACQIASHWAGNDVDFVAAFRTEALQRLMADAAAGN